MKFLKFSVLVFAMFGLAACSPQQPEPQPAASSSSVESSSVASSESASSVSITASESSAESASSTAEPSKTSVQFTFFAEGKEIGSFEVQDAVGKSVLDAMKSNPEIKFVFNEEEGVIDDMFDYKNDYAASVTWVYLLNDQMADFGVVSQKLSEGDRIAWHFSSVDELPVTIIPAAE
ncbi:MAG: DUF4430 domain-containing protein [Aerococcaceae bacterium]|nr:DUF4430 domain-containing protein [Aerococcaceae bacterium]